MVSAAVATAEADSELAVVENGGDQRAARRDHGGVGRKNEERNPQACATRRTEL